MGEERAATLNGNFLPHETKLEPTHEQIATYGVTATELSDIFKDSKIQRILIS